MRLVSPDSIAAVTIRMEAEGEPYNGKVAVGEVIRRRTARRWFSDGTFDGTCLRLAQFSGWNRNTPLLVRALQSDDSDQAVADCVKAWQESATSIVVPECVQYYSIDIPEPSWARDFVFVVQVGKHRFYRRKTAAEMAA